MRPNILIKGAWKYLYRAVDKAGSTIDFLLTARRDRKAVLRFLRRTAGRHGVPKKVTIDKTGANTAVIESYNTEHGADIEIRQIKFLNNAVWTRPPAARQSGWLSHCLA